jgi:hypothetical protein
MLGVVAGVPKKKEPFYSCAVSTFDDSSLDKKIDIFKICYKSKF